MFLQLLLSHRLINRSLRKGITGGANRHVKWRGALLGEPTTRWLGSGASGRDSGEELPLVKLQNWHQQHFKEESDFVVRSEKQPFEDGRHYWTAEFQFHPSSAIIGSGSLRETASLGEMKGEFRYQLLNGKVFYRKKRMAIQAAAARAIDSIQYHARGITEPRLCFDDPSQTEPPPSYPEEDDNKIFAETPKALLHKYFDAKFEGNLQKDTAFETSLLLADGRQWWTASFVSPISDQVYESGSLKNEEQWGEVHYNQGKAYYPKVKSAIHAASARFLDIARYHEEGISEPRLCLEDPSVAETLAGEHLEAENRQLVERHSLSTQGSSLFGVRSLGEADDTEDIAELTLQQVGNPHATTLERLVEAWSESIVASPLATTEGPSPPLGLAEDREQIMNDAKAWCASMKPVEGSSQGNTRKTFQNQIALATVSAGNSILSALSRANRCPIPVGSGVREVQKLADMVLDFVWSSEDQQPTVETYNAYLMCIGGANAKDIAEEAHRVFRHMIDGTPHGQKILPGPNVETFNAMIWLWSRVGHAVGRDRCEEIFRLLEETPDSVPDYSSFLAILSSQASSQTFDRMWVDNWIRKMAKEYHQLEVDEKICNAGLPRSGQPAGGLLFAVPWDRHDLIFFSGYKGANKKGELNAEQIEKWVLDMENSKGIVPTIESYESIIQAWVRTGTRKGVEKAASWVSHVLDSSTLRHQARLETVHPVLAALAFTGESPQGLLELVERLTKLGDTNPKIQPDSRVHALKVTSWAAHTKHLCRNLGKKSNDEAQLNKVRQAATISSVELKELCLKLESSWNDDHDDPFFLEAATFVDAVSAWDCLASIEAKNGARPDFRQLLVVVREVLGILEQFNSTLSFLHGVHRNQHDEDTLSSSADLQLQHLLLSSCEVYQAVVGVLNNVDTGVISSDHPAIPFLVVHSLSVEDMLRRSAENRLVAEAFPRAPRQVEYTDRYSYHSVDSNPTTQTLKEVRLYAEVASGVRAVIFYGGAASLRDKTRLVAVIFQKVKELQSETNLDDMDLVRRFISDVLYVLGQVPRQSELAWMTEHVLQETRSLCHKYDISTDGVGDAQSPASSTVGQKAKGRKGKRRRSNR